jgi:protein-S-isoprenylcysteine O-methyltransferase Ste14
MSASKRIILMYDKIMRLPLLMWVSFSAATQLVGSIHYMKTVPIDFIYAINLAMRLSTMSFMLLVAACLIFRSRPNTKATGLEPRVSALAGSFLIYGFALFPRRELTTTAETVVTMLTMVGSVGAIAVLSQLGRSFSIMAETRQLVISGPYRFARHPLYLAEEIATIGLFIQFASIWTALLLAAQIAFQLRRMHNEESILAASFPEYVAYRRTTARFLPGIY